MDLEGLNGSYQIPLGANRENEQNPSTKEQNFARTEMGLPRFR